MAAWTLSDIPSQAGRLAVVTGATGGLGLQTAQALAGAGAEVILAGRNEAKGRDAVAAILARHPAANIAFSPLDLTSLASVADFSTRLTATHGALDLLVNNAGLMALPKRLVTADGFEMQFGTNYLGHFALTAHLLPLLRAGQAARAVMLSSVVHARGAIDFADLQAERRYRAWPVYAQSKLAMLIFALELQRRSDAQAWGLMSNAAHPGWARTDLFKSGPSSGPGFDPIAVLSSLASPFFSQSAAAGALPTLFAATSPDAVGGGYYGPDGFFELKGDVAPARIAPQAKEKAAAARLWAVSEDLTRVRFPPVA